MSAARCDPLPPGRPAVFIACRVPTYRPFEDEALEHLAALGVGAVEIRVPRPEQLDTVAGELAHFGIRASTLHAECDVNRPDCATHFASQLPAFTKLGTGIALVCPRPEHSPREIVQDRLRQCARAAAAAGVVLAVETHPPIAHHAVEWRRTLAAVNHPALRLNFDTANVYFYNEHADAVSEARQVADTVAEVHIKDTPGGFGLRDFPALGRGTVNFHGVIRELLAAGFAGPLTLEIEGTAGETRTREMIRERIAESVGYLRGVLSGI